MDLAIVDYITKAVAILALCSSIYLLVTNFEPKSFIMKLLYLLFVCATIGFSFSLGFYFVRDEGLFRRMNVSAELLYDVSAAAGGAASLLRLRELLPLIFIFSSDKKMKMFENGIKIAIGIILFCFIRNTVGRLLWYSDYPVGFVYYLFYSQAGLIFYMVCMLSDLIGCTWTATYIWRYFSKKKHPLSKSYGLKVSIALLYMTAIIASVVGALSVNGVIDVLDNITASAVVIYYTFVIRVLLELKKLCTVAFKSESSSSHEMATQ
jgi:hypothetical protein